MAISIKLNLDDKNFQSKLKKVGIGMGAAFAAGSLALKKFLTDAGKLEATTIQFETLTGSAKKATDHVKELVDFTAKTPFQFEGVAQASRTLLAFEVPLEKIPERLQNLGDIAAATGQPLKDLAVIFGQVKSEGRLTGERLRQFQERAVPVVTELSKVMGVNRNQIKMMVSEGKISFADFSKAMDNMNKEGGMAFGAMIKMSKSWGGLLSTLSDVVTILSQRIGEKFLPTAKRMASTMISFIEAFGEKDWAVGLVAGLTATAVAIGGVVVAVTPLLLMGAPIAILSLKIIAVGAAIGGLVGLIYGARKEIGAFLVLLGKTIALFTKIATIKIKGFFTGKAEETKKELDAVRKEHDRQLDMMVESETNTNEKIAKLEMEFAEKRAKRKKEETEKEDDVAREQLALVEQRATEKRKNIEDLMNWEIEKVIEKGEMLTQAEADELKKKYEALKEVEIENELAKIERAKVREEEAAKRKEEKRQLELEIKEIENMEDSTIDEEAALLHLERKKRAAEAEALLERKKRADFIENEEKYGKTIASIHQTLHDKKVNDTVKGFGILLGEQKNANQNMKTLQKTSAITQIGIDTGKAVMGIWASLSGIPIVGTILAAAKTAFVINEGLTQAQAVRNAQLGGTVGRAFGTPSTGDFQPIMAQSGELILPTRDVELNRMANQRILALGEDEQDNFFKEDTSQSVEVSFSGDAASMLQAERREQMALGVGIT